MTLKGALLDSTAAITGPAAKPKTKGKSKVEAEFEHRNQGNTPEAVTRKPRDTRAGHEHHHRHGDRGDDADGEDDGESLAHDLLRGAAKIGAFIGLDPRQTFHGLQRGHIPATKEGKTWVGSKTRLREHYGAQARCARGAD